jgi:protein SCO1/2
MTTRSRRTPRLTPRPGGRRAVRAAHAAAVGVALAALVTACGGTSATKVAAPSFRDGGSKLDARLPKTIEDIPFTDQDGHTVRLSDYAGKTVVLGDILTLCQEHCPIDTATFVELARRWTADPSNAASTVFLSITVDPARDTPAQLAAYRRLYVGGPRHLPQWHLLTASPADLHRLWSFLHVYVQRVAGDGGKGSDAARSWRTGRPLTYDVDHSDDVYFIDGRARERWVFPDQPYLHGAHVPARMQRFMSVEGQRNESKGAWTADEGLTVLSWIRAAG